MEKTLSTAQNIRKEFYLLRGIDTKNEDFEREGYRVISFANIKKEAMAILKDRKTAIGFHLFNRIAEPNNKAMMDIDYHLETVVFKEARGGGGRVCIGWESLESYIRYHSGIVYKWFPE